MASKIYSTPRVREFTSAGAVLNGGKLYFYLAGTTTPATVYTSSAMTTAHAHPVLATTAGLFPAIWLSASVTYDVTCKNSANAVQWTVLNYSDALTAAEVGPALTADWIGQAFYPISAAETGAGLVDADLTHQYIYGDVLRYGADPTGATDSRTAIQDAIASNEVITFPDGDYLINGVASDDAYLHGVLVPYTTQDSVTGNKTFKGSRSVRLLCGSNNMVLWRHSASNCRIEGGMILDVNGKTGCIGLGVMAEDITQTTAVVHQNYNSFEFIWINGAFEEGIYMKAGPLVSGVGSGCWYNDFKSIHAYGAVRGLYMAPPTNTGGSGNNRNNFYGCRFGQLSMNVGMYISAQSGTNKFYGCNFEGIQAGTSPSATPTGVIIENLADVNQFFGCTAEACTRNISNSSQFTELYGCTFVGASLWTEKPLICIGGYDASGTPQRIQGLSYILDDQWAGIPNGVLEVDAYYGLRLPTDKYIWLDAMKTTSSSGGSSTAFTFPGLDYNTWGPSMYLVTRGGRTAAGTSYAHRASIFVETSSGTFVESTRIMDITDGTSVFAGDSLTRSGGSLISTVEVTRAATTFVNYSKITRLT